MSKLTRHETGTLQGALAILLKRHSAGEIARAARAVGTNTAPPPRKAAGRRRTCSR